MDLRAAARKIFLEALQRVQPEKVLGERMHLQGSVLRIDAAELDLRPFQDVRVVAVGKAAVPMTEVLLRTIEPALGAETQLHGVVIGTSVPARPDPRLHYRLGSHPIPDAAAAEAAHQVLALLSGAGPETLVFFLLSGGASAMLELPLDPAMSVGEMAAFHRALVHSGLPIAAMNTLRKHLSAVKGGRLAMAAAPARQCTLLVSDVPPAVPEVVGSGPSMPDSSTAADCRRLLSGFAAGVLPPVAHRLLQAPDLAETPKPGDAAFRRSSFHLLLSGDHLARSAAAVAEGLGLRVVQDHGCDEWPARAAAEHLLHALECERREGGPVCVVSVGEVAVSPGSSAGIGGRNQHFALECAQLLAERQIKATVLSAGSDGADGNSPAAGAIVDEATVQRARDHGFEVDAALGAFDAFPLLTTTGEALITGPTGNNLRDLRLLLRT